MENEQLILRYLENDDNRGYVLLYDYFYTPLVFFSNKYINDIESSEDIVQEFFVSLIGKSKEFKNFTALKVFLYESVKNSCLNYLRHQAVKDKYYEKVVAENDSIDLFWERVIEEDMYAYVIYNIQKLPRQYRNVLTMTLEGMKISEIAEILQISLETAKEYKKDAKKRLISNMKVSEAIILVQIIFS